MNRSGIDRSLLNPHNMAMKVARRYLAGIDSTAGGGSPTDQQLSPDLVTHMMKGLDQAQAPSAYLRLQQLVRALQSGTLDLRQSDLAAYLSERDVPDDEVQAVLRIRVPRPRPSKQVSFVDAFLAFGHATGVSVVPDMRLEQDQQAGKAVMSWLAGWKKLRPLAKKAWSQQVRKVRFGRPLGSEDASWQLAGTLHLDATRSADPATRASQLTHELGHALEGSVPIHDPPWGQPPFCSDYAAHKPSVEDFAESFRMFVEEPASLKRSCPDKWTALKQLL